MSSLSPSSVARGATKVAYQSIGLGLYRNGIKGRRSLDVGDKADLVMSTSFSNLRERTLEVVLEPSARPYVILPTTFDPGQAR